jgi:hypothetical protein
VFNKNVGLRDSFGERVRGSNKVGGRGFVAASPVYLLDAVT